MNRRFATGLSVSAALVTLSGCGTSATPAVTGSTSPTTSVTSSTPSRSSATTTTPSPIPTPDADSIARILLAIPAAKRPSFLDPYGQAIGGARLGLGPNLRISGYRADPLYVCIQHVDMKAGTAGAWSAYAVSADTARSWGGSTGPFPPAPGRSQVLE